MPRKKLTGPGDDLVLVPRRTAERKSASGGRGRALREWICYGDPEAELRRSGQENVVMGARFVLPMDVLSCPRSTRNTSWTRPVREYILWKKMFRRTLVYALERAGYDTSALSVPGEEGTTSEKRETLFHARTIMEPTVGSRRTFDTRPLLLSVKLRTQLRGDLSNRLKSIEDAGNGLLWDDDYAIGGGAFLLEFAKSVDPCCTLVIQAPMQGVMREVMHARIETAFTFAVPEKAPEAPLSMQDLWQRTSTGSARR